MQLTLIALGKQIVRIGAIYPITNIATASINFIGAQWLAGSLMGLKGTSLLYIILLSYTSVYSPPPTYSLVLFFRTPTCFFDLNYLDYTIN
jgi:hypothetical protein